MGSVEVICLLRESVLLVTGERPSCYGRAFFLLQGERFSCYGGASFLLREADFSVGRIDFSTSRKCFSAFAQVHLSPLTSVFMYSCSWFPVLLQAHHVLCMSSWRVCKQGFSPAPPCPVVAPYGGTVRCQKSGIEICMSEFLYRLSKGFVLYVGYSLGVS